MIGVSTFRRGILRSHRESTGGHKQGVNVMGRHFFNPCNQLIVFITKRAWFGGSEWQAKPAGLTFSFAYHFFNLLYSFAVLGGYRPNAFTATLAEQLSDPNLRGLRGLFRLSTLPSLCRFRRLLRKLLDGPGWGFLRGLLR